MFSEIVKDEIYRGYRVLVKQVEVEISMACPYGHWYCGYVEIPKHSKFYGINASDALDNELKVYGGIAYANKLPETGNFVLGFDFHHTCGFLDEQDMEFTLIECHKLVDQIIEKEEVEMLNTLVDELKCLKERDDRERTERLPYWKQIIEDLTGYEIAELFYDDKFEFLEVFWADACREKLVINIRMDSLRACTHDVIRQTYSWLERN